MDGVTGPCRTTAAVSVTETWWGQTPRILSGLTAGKTHQSTGSQTHNCRNTRVKGAEVSVTGGVNVLRGVASLTSRWCKWDHLKASVFLHLCVQPFGPICDPSGQRSHLSPVTPSLQLQRPLLSHVLLTDPEGKETSWEVRASTWHWTLSLFKPVGVSLGQVYVVVPHLWGCSRSVCSSVPPPPGRSRPCSVHSVVPQCFPGSPRSADPRRPAGSIETSRCSCNAK